MCVFFIRVWHLSGCDRAHGGYAQVRVRLFIIIYICTYRRCVCVILNRILTTVIVMLKNRYEKLFTFIQRSLTQASLCTYVSATCLATVIFTISSTLHSCRVVLIILTFNAMFDLGGNKQTAGNSDSFV